ncbi:ThiF family adenylyltransferase [Mesorhizobium sp.]|uniref:ThiF family adenylyltransferase n=1 Tax=Mesorhizobium sp. TaxID=1871066 RepID=UPI000FEA8713|nr:ThiF family adenylyltransferase [Mesorhizobium sp.]RWK53165.1 MAG: ThiF family adenylyltransferase [Mesorhizobium sp.]TIP43520.1 MAG: ThiF family adenylyltransferase [Mesorhizobium sp.]
MTDTVPVTLTLTGDQHAKLRRHLFPGDGKEAAAIAVCGRRAGNRRHRLVARDIFLVPHTACSERTATRVTWPPDLLDDLLERACAERLSVVKIHSHPTGYGAFSGVDDEGDRRLLPMIRGWVEADVLHGSAVMLPDGQMFGRVMNPDGKFRPLYAINVVGDDLHFWYADAGSAKIPDFVASHAQAFDEGTIERLRRLSVAVIGCSGTGSPVIEQLIRLGVGVLVIVDDDFMETRNVNRILNSTMRDVGRKRSKVAVMAGAIRRAGLGTRVISLQKNLWDPDVVREVAQCDVVFGCMDTVDGRFLLNTLATFYNMAYFDIGVRLDAVREGNRKGIIREVCGTIHYLQPGRSSLMSRGLFTMTAVAAAGLRRNDPAAHAQQLEDGYIAGVPAHRPAVISVNMLAASLAVNELLARIHPFREEPNRASASVIFSLSSMELMPEAEEGRCGILAGSVGKGDIKPLLGQMDLAERRSA